MKTLIIFRGIPGSGKSTMAEAVALAWKQLGKTVAGPFEADHYMVDEKGNYKFDPKRLGYCHKSCLWDCEMAMDDGADVVIQSNTNVKHWEFAKYVELAKDNGYTVQEVIVKGDFGNTHGVPADKVKEMKERFEYE